MHKSSVRVAYEWVGKHIDPYSPEFKTDGSSGADLRADISKPFVLMSGEFHSFDTGIRLRMPKGIDAQIRSRSGLAMNFGAFVLTGTIDSDYTGELSIILGTCYKLVVEPGDRLAQLVFSEQVPVEFREQKIRDIPSRGSKGFGSTGLK